jgi:hypothetical protein
MRLSQVAINARLYTSTSRCRQQHVILFQNRRADNACVGRRENPRDLGCNAAALRQGCAMGQVVVARMQSKDETERRI